VITILVVAGPAEDLARVFARHPSLEVLTAADAEDALEKLARNRRIDAVLLLGGPAAPAMARLILEEDPGAPPLYAPESFGAAPAALPLADASPEVLIETVARLLQPEG
jgi:hypothetical protein